MLYKTGRSPWLRLYNISVVPAIIVTLPFILLIIWILTGALTEYNKLSRALPNLDFPYANKNIIHWYVKNGLHADYLKFSSPEMPLNEDIPTLELAIDGSSLSELNSNLPVSGKEKEYKAFVKFKGRRHTVKARYMGDNYWHWLYPQKSWRLKTKKSKLIENTRKINIKNPRTTLTFNEPIAQELAREIGLLAPRVYPVKLVVNNVYMGVHLFWDKIDESILRNNARMPGSIYSGDGAKINPQTGVSMLWEEEKWWKKDSSRNAEQKNDRRDIREFIKGINSDNLLEFYDFIESYLDKNKYALYLSLDNLTASMHHDYHHNNKYYFDPFKGKFEPVSWDIDKWHLTNINFDAGGNPLLNQWKLIPEFELLRQKTLYRLIKNGKLKQRRVLSKVERYYEKIRPSLVADSFKDSLYSQGINVLNMPVAPLAIFDIDKFDQTVATYKEQISQRYAFLQEHLNNSKLSYKLTAVNGDVQKLSVLSDGNVGRRLSEVIVGTNAKHVSIYRDSNLNGIFDQQDKKIGLADSINGIVKVELAEEVFPGFKKTPLKTNYKVLFGEYRLEPAPINYDYFIEVKDSHIDSILLRSSNIITGKESSAKLLSNAQDTTETLSLHPWMLPEKAEKKIKTIGPGVVNIDTDLIISKNEVLQILAGTKLKIKEGVSIFSYGKVIAVGTKLKPIVFEPNGKEPWGTFVIQGHGANNSQFEYCNWSGGSISKRNLITYSGMVSAHDVDEIHIKNSKIGQNYIGDDALHIAYSKEFVLDGLTFENARSDALDIDLSKGVVRNSKFVKSGNDAIDFMTSEAVVESNYILESGDKGISVGESSRLSIDNTVIERSQIGIQVKDQSLVDFGDNLIRKSPLAIHLYKKNWRYDDGGELKATNIHAHQCDELVKADKFSVAYYKKIIQSGEIKSSWSKTITSAGASF